MSQTTDKLYASPSPLSSDVRARMIDELNQRLIDGLDLHGQIKVAHWNIKGPHFATLHPLFETFAVSLAMHNDELAERAVTLGGIAKGTSRMVVDKSNLEPYPLDVTRDLEHVELLAERIGVYLNGLRASRGVADEAEDIDSSDLMTAIITEFEKHVWFLRATLGA